MSGPSPRPGYPGILRYERPQPVNRFRPSAAVWWVVAGVVVLAGLGAGGVRALRSRRVAAVRVEVVVGPGAQRKLALVEVATARGVVVPRTVRVVYPRRRGRLAQLGAGPGSSVREGAFVARLENRAQADAAEAAESLLSGARQALVSAQTPRNPVAIQAAARQVTVALERSRRAQVLLNETYVSSPMLGTVYQRLATVGDSVAPQGDARFGRGILSIVDQVTQQVHAQVPAGMAARLFRDQAVRIQLDTMPRRPLAGAVAAIEPGAGQGGATLVKVNFVERDRRVFPGLVGNVVFLARAAPRAAAVIDVAETALRQDRGQSVVWVVAQGELQRRVVDPAPETGPRRVIRAGLVGGETIVVGGPSNLQPGQRVRILPPPGAAAVRDSASR